MNHSELLPRIIAFGASLRLGANPNFHPLRTTFLTPQVLAPAVIQHAAGLLARLVELTVDK